MLIPSCWLSGVCICLCKCRVGACWMVSHQLSVSRWTYTIIPSCWLSGVCICLCKCRVGACWIVSHQHFPLWMNFQSRACSYALNEVFNVSTHIPVQELCSLKFLLMSNSCPQRSPDWYSSDIQQTSSQTKH